MQPKQMIHFFTNIGKKLSHFFFLLIHLFRHKSQASKVSIYFNRSPMPLPPLIRKISKYVPLVRSLFIVFLVATIALLSYEAQQNRYLTEQMQNTGQALMHAQRLAKNINLIFSDVKSYQEIADSKDAVSNHLNYLEKLQNNAWFRYPFMREKLNNITPKWQITKEAAELILNNQQALINSNHSYQTIMNMDDIIVKRAQKIELMIKQKNIDGEELLTASALSVLSGKIIYSTQRIYTQANINQDMVSEILDDLASFQRNIDKLKKFSLDYEMGTWYADFITPEIDELKDNFAELKLRAEDVLKDLPSILKVKKAQTQVLKTSEFLRLELDLLQKNILPQSKGLVSSHNLAIIMGVIASLLFALLLYINRQDLLNRAWEAQQREAMAEKNRIEEERKNERNQKSIVRLMNELQDVANGNLTQFTTVDGGITSAIADTINYTIEELRELVARVTNTSEQIFLAFDQATKEEQTMMTGIHQQSKLIIDVSKSIQTMAERIEQLSDKSLTSIELSKKSNTVTEQNKQATDKVLSSIQDIRQHIKDTYQHIKRLGERSLEISEVNEFTANLTQQIHILALNAAVIVTRPPQEQSKGLNVIAQEVQKLAERSNQSMEQVQKIIQTIQSEVKDATTAIEKSTQSVVQVTELSEQMSHAVENMDLTHLDLINSVQSLIQDVLQESEVGHRVVQYVQEVLNMNEKTLKNTQNNQQATQNLTHLIKNLQQSVKRFTID